MDLLRNKHDFPETKWFQLGMNLNVAKNDLEDIEYKHKNDTYRCLCDCLSAWLRSGGDTNCKILADAIRKCKEEKIANEIYGN